MRFFNWLFTGLDRLVDIGLELAAFGLKIFIKIATFVYIVQAGLSKLFHGDPKSFIDDPIFGPGILVFCSVYFVIRSLQYLKHRYIGDLGDIELDEIYGRRYEITRQGVFGAMLTLTATTAAFALAPFLFLYRAGLWIFSFFRAPSPYKPGLIVAEDTLSRHLDHQLVAIKAQFEAHMAEQKG